MAAVRSCCAWIAAALSRQGGRARNRGGAPGGSPGCCPCARARGALGCPLTPVTMVRQSRRSGRGAQLDGETLARILRMGHSRLPVHDSGDRSHLLGVVLVKELVLLDPDDRVPPPPPLHPPPLPPPRSRPCIPRPRPCILRPQASTACPAGVVV